MLQGVEVGNAEHVGHQRTGARTTPRPHGYAVLARPANEVGDDEEVALEAHVADAIQLELQACVVLHAWQRANDQLRSRFQRREATVETGHGFIAQKLRRRHAIRDGVFRQEALAETHLQRTAARDSQGVVASAKQVGKEFAHFGRRAQVLLVGIDPRARVVGQLAAFMNTNPCLVGLEVILRQKPYVVGRHQRCRHFTHQFQRGIDERFFLRAPSALHFQVVAVTEQP